MTPPGIDQDAVDRWLSEHLGVAPPCRFELIAGGNSNLTYRVEDASGWVAALRRPPLARVLKSAHDMAREYRVISALHETPVPVPEPFGLCDDESVNDAPFYVMAFVEGLVPHDAEGGALVDPSERAAVSGMAIDVLASLHGLDPDEIGLGSLGRREDYVARQLHRWARQWEASKQREIPAMDAVRARLEAEVPEQRRSTVVHGDYRLGNMILSGGRVRAVLDWELCTLGDPLADVGYLLNSWLGPDDPVIWRSSATQAGGYLDATGVMERYASATGADLSGIGYYQAFQAWRLAAILEGVYARYLHGAMGSSEGVDLELMAGSVVQLAERALDHLS